MRRLVGVRAVDRQIHLYVDPQRFVAGTVGQPGERTFYLQATDGARVTSVALEKEQVAVLAERVDQLLDEVSRTSDVVVAQEVGGDLDPLTAPIVEEFRVGAMALGWDSTQRRVVIEAHASVDMDGVDIPDIDENTTSGPDTLRVRLTAPLARAFAARARVVVSAGRPPCPFCDLPLDPVGHICPRANGYRRRTA